MRWDDIDKQTCSVARALSVVGERWTMLIIRDAFLGTRRFEEFQKRLGIARNILTARLKNLCANEILDRVPVKEGAKRHEYILTRKGKDMMPLLVSLTQWGDKWVFGEGKEPVIFQDREHNEPISRIQVYSAKGEVLRPRDIRVKAGPGATPEARDRIDELNENERNRD